MGKLMFTVLLFAASLAFGQQSTTHLSLVYNGATPGRIRGWDQDRSNYTDLIFPASMAANGALTFPNETGNVVATENHVFGATGWALNTYRAQGTAASPTDANASDSLGEWIGWGRSGGSYSQGASIRLNVVGTSPYTGSIDFYTRNTSSYSPRININPDGHLLPYGSAQNLGEIGAYWQSLYLNSQVVLNRAARTTAQRLSWTVAGSSAAPGAWLAGVGPNASESQFEISHTGSPRIRLTESSGIFSSDNFFPSVTNTYALGSPTFRWNNLYAKYIDVEGDIQPNLNNTVPLGSSSLRFSKLWVVDLDCSGTCTGATLTPPVTLSLDTTSTVLTLETHNSGGGFQFTQRHSRGTAASPIDTVDDDRIGQIAFQLYGGGGYRDAAAIRAYAEGIPSGTSAPAGLRFFVSPAGSTTPTERAFLQHDGEWWFRSSMGPDRLVYLQNDSVDGYSSIAFLDNSGFLMGSVGYHNISAPTFPQTFWIGSIAGIGLTFVTGGAAKWSMDTGGVLYPITDGGPSIGTSLKKPSYVMSRGFFTETASAFGTQQNTFIADSNLNLYLISASSAAATDRASLQFYRYRNTYASPVAVANGDRLGNIAFFGHSGFGTDVPGAVIESYVNGTVSAGIVPAELRFRTHAAGTLADRVVISSAGIQINNGSVFPSAAAGGSSGSSSAPWANTFTNYLTMASGAGYGVVGDFVPSISGVSSLGNASYRWSYLHADRVDSYNDFAIVSSGISRIYANSSTLALIDSGGFTTGQWLTSDGSLTTRNHSPQASNSYDLGSSGVRWRDAYFSRYIYISAGGSINAPDGNFGMNFTASFRNSAGTGTCTVTFSGGIATATTCF